ncbi:MraY family glycosyltransferase [Legionella impletisoli]|uniref:Undecaprenyl-phosphate alpha-N-acetylglucosaminyl 1-phosphate transferase n=1 Tax=Legionella impletisoli TaxID=343510 RepID=A0A917JQU4_9GAMM|nr:MraY family glycosyltransferase [Legionella impletisoli]GGI81954.1 undecaprenyl-phosphate alpha-N-acetylglucosaminyl 1-phosphate transferase [Legionella impletisoli]
MQYYAVYVVEIAKIMLITGCGIFILTPLARVLNLMDYPGGRKAHLKATPLIGGIAIFFGLVLSVYYLPISKELYHHVLLGSFILLLIGAVDDRFDIRPRLRLVIQISAIFYMILAGKFCLNYVGEIFYFTDIYLHKISIPLTLILTLGFINAINMLDGQDGLAGGVVLTESLLLFAVSYYLGQTQLALLLLTFIGLLAVFLLFNMPLPWRHRASVFLGDSGSNFMAFFIAWCVIYLSQIESQIIKPITLIWIVAFPFFDMTSACLIRTKQKRSWADPGHDHIHHLLRKFNIPVFWSTFLLSGLSLGYGLLGVLFAWGQVSEGLQSYLYLVCFASYLLFTNWLSREHRNIQSSFNSSIDFISK